MLRKNEDQAVDTGTFLLVFSGTTLPEKVRVGWMAIKVRPFTPNPTRCFKCQRFGHVANNCKGKERCGRCSLEGHNSKSCKAETPKCAGCGNEHEAWSRSCPRLTEAKESQRKKVPPPPKKPSAKPLQAPSDKPAPGRSPYRDALVGSVNCPPPNETHEEARTPLNIESSMAQYMNLSLGQFLAMVIEMLSHRQDKAQKSVLFTRSKNRWSAIAIPRSKFWWSATAIPRSRNIYLILI